MGFAISTSIGGNVDVDVVYMDVMLVIIRCELSTNLIPLLFHDFEIILGIDWLNSYRAQMDFFAKIIIFYGPTGTVIKLGPA